MHLVPLDHGLGAEDDVKVELIGVLACGLGGIDGDLQVLRPRP